jgi:drug/metabolite transporter (DMT)-like permease
MGLCDSAAMTARDRSLAIIACLLWSTGFVGVKAGLDYMPPLTLAGMRFVLAGLLLLPWCGGVPTLRTAWTQHRSTVIAASLLNTVGLYAIFFMALQVVRGAQAAIMIGASPLVAAVVAHFVMPNDRMTRRKSVSILLGVSGIVLLAVAGKPWEPVGALECGGLLLLLCASITGALGNVVVARGRTPSLHPVALTSLQMLLGGSILLAAGLTLEGVPSLDLPFRFYAILGWLSFLSACAFAIWFHLLQRVPVSELNLWKFIIPLAGAGLSWLLISGEKPDLWSACGMLLVAGGIMWSQRPLLRSV